MEEYSQIRVTETGKTKTAFTLTGIWRGYEDNELKEMICNENEDIKVNFGNSFVSETTANRRHGGEIH